MSLSTWHLTIQGVAIMMLLLMLVCSPLKNVQIKPHQYVCVEKTQNQRRGGHSVIQNQNNCLRANASCSSKCKCKKCANPFGVSTKDYHEEQSKISRKRKRTEMGGERLRGEDFF